MQVAAEKEVGGLVLDAPYTSIVDVAEVSYPYLPVRPFMFDRYETMRFLPQVTAPLLVMHGEDDRVIPVEMGKAVYAAANAPKEIVTFPRAGHSDHHLYGSYDELFRWVDALRAKAHAREAGRRHDDPHPPNSKCARELFAQGASQIRQTSSSLAARAGGGRRRRRLAGQQAFALGALAGQLARAAHSLGLLASLTLGGLLEIVAELHFPENALALHLLLERLESLIDVVVADENLQAGASFA